MTWNGSVVSFSKFTKNINANYMTTSSHQHFGVCKKSVLRLVLPQAVWTLLSWRYLMLLWNHWCKLYSGNISRIKWSEKSDGDFILFYLCIYLLIYVFLKFLFLILILFFFLEMLGLREIIREVADSRSWGIFIRDTAYFIVIQWSMTLCFIESQWNMPYPVWKCLKYGSPQPP